MENQPENTVISSEAATVEEEDSVTIGEVMQDLAAFEEEAEVLFGAQDPSVCTYPEGYVPRQTVFTCLTCTPDPKQAGICYGCSLNCHDGHQIVELYTKRKFRCDCGNSKFGEKCELYEEKDESNQYNTYNHNYSGKFCTCDIFYPEDKSGHEMLQCEICEDWFHEMHMPSKTINLGHEPTSSEVSSFICSSCVKKLPCLVNIPPGTEPFCHSKVISPDSDQSTPIDLLIYSFRSRLCKCSDCTRVYEMADCEFLLDDEDDIGTFEMRSKTRAAENKTTDADDMRELVREVGMDGAQKFYEGVNDFKRKLNDFMGKTAEGGKTISEDDVKKFFSDLNDERLEKRRRFE